MTEPPADAPAAAPAAPVSRPAEAPAEDDPETGFPDPGWPIVEGPAPAEHRATVFLLHGLGADGHDFAPIVPGLRLPESLGVRFRFPEAPLRPVTVNQGFVMRAWYDLEALGADGRANRAHLAEAVAGVRALVAGETRRGIPAERIVLAGFSQGGAVALAAAACRDGSGAGPLPLGGVAALSAYLPAPDLLVPAPPGAPPIFLAHGDADPMVAPALGTKSRDCLLAAGWKVDFRSYPMGHQVSAAEIDDLGRFLRRVLGEEGKP